MRAYFQVSGTDVHIGTATFSDLPQTGDRIYLDMSAGGWTNQGQTKPIEDAYLIVDRREWNAFNHAMVETWQHPWNLEKEAFATLFVSALNDETQTYINRLAAKEQEHGRTGE